MTNVTCDLYGCNRDRLIDATVEVAIPGIIGNRTLKVCDYHLDLFKDFDPEMWAIGTTYTNQVEIRPIPAQPTPEEE